MRDIFTLLARVEPRQNNEENSQMYSIKRVDPDDVFEFQSILNSRFNQGLVEKARGQKLPIETKSRRSWAQELKYFTEFYEKAFNAMAENVLSAFSCSKFGTTFLIEDHNQDGFIAINTIVLGANREGDDAKRYESEIYAIGLERSPLMALANELLELLEKIPNPNADKPSGSVFLLNKTKTGYSLTNIGQVPLAYKPHHYSEDVNKRYSFIKEQLIKDNPRGRLVILEGPPGTGKTSLLRTLFTDLDKAVFINFPAMYLTSLDDPGLISFFAQQREQWEKDYKFILVLEDADACLVPRDMGNISLISTLLNACDGIVGSITDLRIIATTNAAYHAIDQAIVRPGRLISHISVGKLSPSQATHCYNQITGKTLEFTKDATLAEIYQLVNSTEEELEIYAKQSKKRIGFN
jgi:hypothetical protein